MYKHLFVGCEYTFGLMQCVSMFLSNLCVDLTFVCSTHEEKEKKEDEYGGQLNPFTTYYKSSWWSVHTYNTNKHSQMLYRMLI